MLEGASLHLHEKEVLFGPLAHLSATFSASFSASLKHSPNLPKTTLSDRRESLRYETNESSDLSEGVRAERGTVTLLKCGTTVGLIQLINDQTLECSEGVWALQLGLRWKIRRAAPLPNASVPE